MDLKQQLIVLLNTLQNDREAAKGLIELITNSNVSDNLLDSLLGLIKQEIKKVTDVALRKKLEKTAETITRLKERENKEREKEAEELKSLEEEFGFI